MSFLFLISLLSPLCMSVCLSVCVYVCSHVEKLFLNRFSSMIYPQTRIYNRKAFPETNWKSNWMLKSVKKNLITHDRHHVLAQKCTHWCGIGLSSTCLNFKEIDQKLLFLWVYLSFVIFQNIDIFQGSTKAGGNTSK